MYLLRDYFSSYEDEFRTLMLVEKLPSDEEIVSLFGYKHYRRSDDSIDIFNHTNDRYPCGYIHIDEINFMQKVDF